MKRLTQSLVTVLIFLFALATTASAQFKDDVCKDGSWQEFRFKSQGQCIALVGSGEVPVWSLHRDFLLYPDNQNPSPDQYGNANVWHYRYSVSPGHDPAAYFLYTDYLMDWSGIREAWTAGTINESYSPLLGVRDDDGGAVLHPYEFATIASWRSPINGWIGVRGNFFDIQRDCGDGVTWAIDHETSTKDMVRDQGQLFNTGGEIELGTDIWSQSITTGIAGQLAGIQIQIHYGPLPGNFELSVFSGGNPPAGDALYSQRLTIAPEDLDDNSVFMWDVMDANLFFNANDAFTFVISAEQAGFNIAGNDPPGYDYGDLFKNGSGPMTGPGDMAFITYVITEEVGDIISTIAQGTVRRPTGDFAGRFNFGFRLPVSKGDFLDFIVDPGPVADSSCDTTWAEITIVRSPPRN
jgi:hypothetical protein